MARASFERMETDLNQKGAREQLPKSRTRFSDESCDKNKEIKFRRDPKITTYAREQETRRFERDKPRGNQFRQRKRKGRPVSGWVILDKPQGMGSTQAVAKIKGLFNAEKAGHAGTLDPLASGLLPIALGEATKTVPYVMEGAKIYQFRVNWGQERTTDDREGEVTKTSDLRPTRDEIEALLPLYIGFISQVPPQFSAVKIDGNRAYDLARGGERVEIKPREVEILEFNLVEMTTEGDTIFTIECGKGTYVRSLARDLGRDLGCYGYIADLRRLEVAPFCEEHMITLEVLEATCPPRIEAEADGILKPRRDFSKLDNLLIATGEALATLPQYPVGEAQAQTLRRGQAIVMRGRDVPLQADEACATYKGKVLALGLIENGQFVPKRVFAA